MKILYLLLTLIQSKIIKNLNIPSCKNCIHFMPKYYSSDYVSNSNTCNKFGDKNIITDEIEYDFINSCRKDENKCGNEGKFFEKDNYVQLKIFKYKLVKSIPYLLLIFSLITSTILRLYY